MNATNVMLDSVTKFDGYMLYAAINEELGIQPVDPAVDANAAAIAARDYASSASTTATQLMNWLESKETLTAPAVDSTLSISGAAADAKVTGKSIQAIYDGKERLLLTTLPGFINVDGTIAAQSAPNKDVYTNRIPVEPGDVFDISLEYGTAHSMGLTVARYDNTGTFVERSYIVSSVTQATYNGQYTVPAGTSYVAFSYRTFDDATFSVMQELAIIPKVDETLSISGRPADAKVTGDSIKVTGASIDAIYVGNRVVRTALSNGYFGSDGSIVPATSTQNEKYTEKISVTVGEKLLLNLQYASSNTIWLAVAEYDADRNFRRRVVIDSSTVGTNFDYEYITPVNVAYVAFTFRTYSGASFVLRRQSEGMFELIADNKEVKEKFSSITGTSRNIFSAEWEQAYYSSSGAYIVSATSKYSSVAPVVPVIGGTTYMLSWGDVELNTGNISLYIEEFSENDTFIKRSTRLYSYHQHILTVDANTSKVGFMMYSTITDTWEKLTPSFFQVELLEATDGRSPTQYVPHNILLTERIDVLNLFDQLKRNLIPFEPSKTVKTIAHRGDCLVAPQCTAPSYVCARKRGITTGENDITVSEDGQFVMWHDTTLGRLGDLVDINGYLMYTDGTNYYWVEPTTNDVYTWDGSNYIASSVALNTLTRCSGENYAVNSMYGGIGLNYDILKRIDFGVYKGSEYQGTQILSFAEWILLSKQLGMDVYIDTKITYTDEQLTEAANIVKKLGMANHASWVMPIVTQTPLLRSIIPEARCLVLEHPSAQNVVDYAQYNVGGGFVFYGNARVGMTESAIQLGLNAGYDVEVWYVEYGSNETIETINNMIKKAVSYGVQGMAIDHYRVSDAFMYMFE